MKSIICTLYENDLHYGVAALVNSLCRHGYEGDVYVGYRGELPPWVDSRPTGGTYPEFRPTERVVVRFIRLTTEVHLGHYKPTFMLSLLNEECRDAEACFYFDPDIVILCRWSYYEEWASGGVALCADDTPDMPVTHPLRNAWRRYFAPLGVALDREQSSYLNSGFVGVIRQNRGFLEMWQRLIKLCGPAAGDLKYLNLNDATILFAIPDQDCLNAATMACHEPLSCMGRDGMDFSKGFVMSRTFAMSHAIGTPKPWTKNPLWAALRRGERPTRADETFLKYAGSPICLYSSTQLWLKRKVLRPARLLAKAHI